MTGLQHYREAERLLAEALRPDSYDYPAEHSGRLIAAAQVHATLALAASSWPDEQIDKDRHDTRPAVFDPAHPEAFA